MTSAQEAADLQAAMDASAMDVPNKPTAAAAAATAGPAAVSASASGAAGPPAIVFHLVTNMAEFKTQINGALKRLQDANSDSYIEVDSFCQLLDATISGTLGEDATRYVLRDVLLPGVTAVLARTYAHEAKDMALVTRVIHTVLDIIAQHQKNNLPAQMPALPALTSLPVALLAPPPAPALTLPPVDKSALGPGAAQSGATSSSSSSSSASSSSSGPPGGTRITIGGVEMPVALPVQAIYGPQLPDQGGASSSASSSAASSSSSSSSSAAVAGTAPPTVQEEKGQEKKATEATAETAAMAPAGTDAAATVVPTSPEPTAETASTVSVTVSASDDCPPPSFLDIARGGLPSSPFASGAPPRSLSPAVPQAASPANNGAASTSSLAPAAVTSPSTAGPTLAPATQFNRDLDQQLMDVLDVLFDDSKPFYQHYGVEPIAPLVDPAAAAVTAVASAEGVPAHVIDPTLDPQSAEMIAFRAGLKIGEWVDVLCETGSGSTLKRTWRCAVLHQERNPGPPPAHVLPPPLPTAAVAATATAAPVAAEGAAAAPAVAAEGAAPKEGAAVAGEPAAAVTDAAAPGETAAPAVTAGEPGASAEASPDVAPPASAAPSVIIPPAPPAEWRLHFEGQTDNAMEWMRKSEAVWRLSPLYSRTGLLMDRWRMELAVGSPLDCCDYLRKWYTATVVETRGALVLVRYDGWGAAFDDWICRTSERLAPHRSQALGGKSSGGVAATYADRKYNDSLDPESAVAVYRGKEWGSSYLVDAMTYFQQRHLGFDLLISRFVYKHGPAGCSPSMPVPVIRKIVDAMSKVTILYARLFALRFIPMLRMAVCETLLGLSDIELRGLSKEHLEGIIAGLDRILHRIHVPKDVNAFLESFALECAYKRFMSPIVERRINGMASLQEYVTTVRRNGTLVATNTWLTSQGFVEWLSRKRILAEAYGPTGHPELIRKSSEMLKFIAGEHRLDQSQLDLIWGALESSMQRADEPRLAIIYKVLDDIAWNLAVSHLAYLFNKVRTSIPLKDYTAGTLDLIKELTRYTTRSGPEASMHAMDLLWTLSQDDSGAADEIKQAARARLEDGLTMHHKGLRLHYLERCCGENLKAGTSVPQTIALMTKLIDSYPEALPQYHSVYAHLNPSAATASATEDHSTKHTVIMYLNDQYGLMAHLFDDCARFKARCSDIAEEVLGARKQTVRGPRSVPNINSHVISSKTSYLKQVQDRLNFLQYLLVQSNTASSPPPPPATPAAASSPTAAQVVAATEEKKEALPVVAEEESKSETEPKVEKPAEAAAVTEPTPAAETAPTATAAPAGDAASSAPAPDPAFEVPGTTSAPAAENTSAAAPGGPAASAEVTASPAPAAAPAPPVAPPATPAAALPPPPGLKLAQEHLDALWENFYVCSLSAAERESFFRWLRNACVIIVTFHVAAPTSQYSSYTPPPPIPAKSYFNSPALLGHVFEKLLGGVQPQRMELSYYLCFQQCFMALNQREGILELKPQAAPANPSYSSSVAAQAAQAEACSVAALNGDFIIHDFTNLRGFDALWHICLESPVSAPNGATNEVVSKSIEFLNKIYSPTSLSDKLIEGAGSNNAHPTVGPAAVGTGGIAAIRLHYIERCISTFKSDMEASKNPTTADSTLTKEQHLSRASRCLYLLHHLLDSSENLKGLGGLRSHGTQTRGKLLRLSISHPTVTGKKVIAAATSADAASAAAASGTSGGAAPPAKLEVRIYSNSTLFDLRSLLSRELLIPLELLKLYVVGKQLTPSLNRMHLHELGIKDGQALLVSRQQQTIAKVDLVDKTVEGKPMLMPFRVAITEMFFKYAECVNPEAPRIEGYPLRTMSKPNMATYILSCGAGEGSASEERLSSIFKKYAPKGWTNEEELNVEGFCEFYRDACNDRVDNVWSDLRCHGYRYDLRKEADIIAEEAKLRSDPKYKQENSKVLPRYLLASNNDYFSLLFQALLDNQVSPDSALVSAPGGIGAPGEDMSISALIWSLLQRLPSNQDLYMNLFSLQGMTDKAGAVSQQNGIGAKAAAGSSSWDSLLDSRNVYKLLYALQILESLTEPIQDEGAEGVGAVGGGPGATPAALAAAQAQAQAAAAAAEAAAPAVTATAAAPAAASDASKLNPATAADAAVAATAAPKARSAASASSSGTAAESADEGEEDGDDKGKSEGDETEDEDEYIPGLSSDSEPYDIGVSEEVMYGDVAPELLARHREAEAAFLENGKSGKPIEQRHFQIKADFERLANRRYRQRVKEKRARKEAEAKALQEQGQAAARALEAAANPAPIVAAPAAAAPVAAPAAVVPSPAPAVAAPVAAVVPAPSAPVVPVIDEAAEQAKKAELLNARDAWSRQFLHSGGFEHLYGILTRSHLFEEAMSDVAGGAAKKSNGAENKVASTPLTRSLRKKCLTLLLKLLYYYLLAAMNNQAPAAASGPLGFVSRIRSESVDLLSDSEKREEEAAIEREKNRVEAENRAAGGVNHYTPGFTSPVSGPVYGPALPFQNGNGPIVNPNAPPAPALYSSSPSPQHATVEEIFASETKTKSSSASSADDDALPPASRPDLLLLGRQMSSGFSAAVLSCVDFPELLKVLWHIISLAAENNVALASGKGKDEESEDDKDATNASASSASSSAVVLYNPAAADAAEASAGVVSVSAAAAYDQVNTDMAEPALNCLVNIMIYEQNSSVTSESTVEPNRSRLLSQFYSLVESANCVNFFRVLFNPSSTKLRKFFANTILQICRRVHPADPKIKQPQQYFLALLLQHLPSHTQTAGQEFSSADCTEYFGLLSKLVQNRIAECSEVDEFLPILRTLLTHLRAHASLEVPALATSGSGSFTLASPKPATVVSLATPKTDNILCGLLQILNDILCNDKLSSYRERVGQGEETTAAAVSADGGEKKGLVYELFYDFLFTKPLPTLVPSADAPLLELPPPPRCQTKPSRSLAFSLLTTLCDGVPANFFQLHRFLQLQQNSIQTRIKAAQAATIGATSSAAISAGDYQPGQQTVAPSGYVGLRNLGSTCYMNGLLQMFFMIPAFRFGILQAAPTKLTALQAAGPSPALDDSLLYQLQNLFGYLSSSHKQYADTSAFCRSYKDENGQPINPRIQQDSQEFFNVLMDRLEFALKTDSSYAKLISSLFEGKLINQMICHGGCNSVRETTESYMTLSLEVKGKIRMEESLRSYVEGELLSGINCPVCGTKTNDTTKRVCLGALPHTLFFHLKRFELNYESFQHEKLNGRFEFPLAIDLEPFTKEGLARIELEKKAKTDPTVMVPAKYSEHPKEYYEYNLYGILVHTGSAQAGHYYSFIKERKVENGDSALTAGAAGSSNSSGGSASASSAAPSVSGSGSWFEFNDATIRPFDITKDLDEYCFGGESSSTDNSAWGGVESTSERIKNAYMLCYERAGQYRAVPTSQTQVQQMAQAVAAEANKIVTAVESGASMASMAPVDPSPCSTGSTAIPAIPCIPSDFMSVPLSSILPSRIQNQVRQDNAYFMEDRFIFSREYFEFMTQIVVQAKGILATSQNSTSTGTEPQVQLGFTQLATTFLLDTLLRSADTKVVTEYITVLTALYNSHAPSCSWLLEYLMCGGNMAESMVPLSEKKVPSPALLVELLLAQRESYVRKAVLALIMACIHKLYPMEKAQGFWPDVLPDASASAAESNKQAPSCIQRYFLLHHSMLAETAPKNWVRFHEYLQFYHMFAVLTGVAGRRFMIAQGVMGALADLHLQEASPIFLANKSKKRVSMGNMVLQPSFSPLLQCLSLLARTCYLPITFRKFEGGGPVEEVALPIPNTLLEDAYIPVVTDATAEAGVAPGPQASDAAPAAEAIAAPAVEATAAPVVDGAEGAAAASSSSAPAVSSSSSSSAAAPARPPTVRAQPFSEHDYKLLTCPALFATAFGALTVATPDVEIDSLVALACHMCYENPFLSGEIIQIIINGVHKSDATSVKPFFDLMARTVAINDAVQEARYDQLLAPSKGVLHSLYTYRDHSARFTYVSIKFLCRIMSETPSWAKRMMSVRQAAWMWIDRWLMEYANRKPTAVSAANAKAEGPSANPSKIVEARRATFETYKTLVESLGGTLNLEPPPAIILGDGKSGPGSSNTPATPGVGAGAADAKINNKAEEGREMLAPSGGGVARNANGEDSTTPAGEFRAVGVKLDENYIARAVAQAAGASDDEGEFDDKTPGGIAAAAQRARDRSARVRAAALTIALHQSQSSSLPHLNLGAGAGAMDTSDDPHDGAGIQRTVTEGPPGGVDSDEQASSYKQRVTATTPSDGDKSDVSCGICTYLNAHYRQSCEMCGSSLKSDNAHGMD